jgi:glycine hydroxymethyltransferase
MDDLSQTDPVLATLLDQELARQSTTLSLVAASSTATSAVLRCQASVLNNLSIEGYPGERFHAGAAVADRIESLARERACALFGASYANVQPHSGTAANQAVLFSLLRPGDRILALDVVDGGHISHGSPASIAGRAFETCTYRLDTEERIDFDSVREEAKRTRPRVIIAGASAYPREIEFGRFREIADEVGAILLADIAHIAGLIAAGVHPSPIRVAEVATASTYKQLFGPRGGLILVGSDRADELTAALDRGVFPLVQSTPHLPAIAAKAHAFLLANTVEFKQWGKDTVDIARALASAMTERGHRVVSGGTDTHLVLVDLASCGLTGVVAERALEAVGIIANRNRIPRDRRPAKIASGIRFGANDLARRKMDRASVLELGGLIDRVLRTARASSDSDSAARLPEAFVADVRRRVAELAAAYPLPGFSTS